jgi:hypothetical protein
LSTWKPSPLVQVHAAYDREYASNPEAGRFGAYLDRHADPSLWQDWNEGVYAARAFAQAVWHIASPPIMAPGYVRLRPDLIAARLEWSDDGDQHLYAEVEVPLRHGNLKHGAPYPFRDWAHPWHALSENGYAPVAEPDGPTAALLTTTVIRVVADDWALPAPPVETGGLYLYETAREAVDVIARQINAHVGPVVADLIGGAR